MGTFKMPLKAWAVVDAEDSLVLVDARTPIFWLRKVAKAFNDERMNGEGRIVRITIRLAR